MTDTDGHDHDDPEEEMLATVEGVIDAIVEATCEVHYGALTQEPDMTGRIAALIEHVIASHPINVGGLKVEVTTQTLPSLNSRMELEIGADLYISIVRHDKNPPISKGMLVQAKWDDTLNDPRLIEQVGKMFDRTDEAFVWAYGPTGISSFPGSAFDPAGAKGAQAETSPGELISEALRCNRGDEKIGRDLSLPRPVGMTTMLRKLHVNEGLDIQVVSTPRPGAGD